MTTADFIYGESFLEHIYRDKRGTTAEETNKNVTADPLITA